LGGALLIPRGIGGTLVLFVVVMGALSALVLSLRPGNLYAIQLISLERFAYIPLTQAAIMHHGLEVAWRRSLPLSKVQGPALAAVLAMWLMYLLIQPEATLALSTTFALVAAACLLIGTLAALTGPLRGGRLIRVVVVSACVLGLWVFPMWNLWEILPRDFDVLLSYLNVSLLLAFPLGILLQIQLFVPR